MAAVSRRSRQMKNQVLLALALLVLASPVVSADATEVLGDPPVFDGGPDLPQMPKPDPVMQPPPVIDTHVCVAGVCLSIITDPCLGWGLTDMNTRINILDARKPY